MRAQEFITEEYKVIPDVFPDGDLRLTIHYDRDRRVERNIDTDRILDMCHRAAVQWPEKLQDIPADSSYSSFVISDWDNFRVAFIKKFKPYGKISYIVTTARYDLRIGPDQYIIQLR